MSAIRPVSRERSQLTHGHNGGDRPEADTDNWASGVLGKALIFRPDNVLAVDSFEPANGEMTTSHLLKVLNEGVVDGGAA